MISDQTLAQAVDAGIISAAQAESLRALQGTVAAAPAMDSWSAPATPSPDEENLRFAGGFSDIFVSLGILLFFGAAGFFLQRFLGIPAMWAGLAVLAWLLAEFFTRARRMALPSIILLVLFAVSVFAAAMQVTVGWDPLTLPARFAALMQGRWLAATWACGLATAALAGLHYWRFRVPITIAAAAAALTLCFLGLAGRFWPDPDPAVTSGLVLLCGIASFALAMYFDGSDPQRLTRRTDIAFWLHLLAAPLIVHPVVTWLAHGGAPITTPSGAIAILAVFLAFALVAVAIDRRALLVSGLTYAGFALATLLRQGGFADLIVPATLLALGAFILLLSAGWQPLRRALLRLIPLAMTRHLPHPQHRSP